MLGKVVFASLFIGRDGKGWSSDEVGQARRSARRAGEWIEGEAMRWGAAVNVELLDVEFVADDPRVEEVTLAVVNLEWSPTLLEADAITRALGSASRGAVALGFKGLADLVETIERRAEADRFVWLLHLRRAGRSLAVGADEAPLPGLMAAICYAREENFPEPLAGPPRPDSATLAHEALHLFGASDKYGTSLGRLPKGTVTRRDINRLADESRSRLRVDPATAAEIGWAPARVAGAPPTRDDATPAAPVEGSGGRR